MVDMTRREVVNGFAGAAITAGAATASAANADDLPGRQPTATPSMSIRRYGITDSAGGNPIISLATVHERLVYLCGVTADPARLGDIKDQTKQVLERIDRLLGAAGTTKSNLLTVQVWLTNMSHFQEHNSMWNEWVDPKNPPARACLHSPQLWQPKMLVEIMAVAAK